MYERWGALSVRDHKDTASLITNVLLYDRLVMPIPSNESEKSRWEDEEWDPALLQDRLGILGDLAKKRRWHAPRQEEWRTKFSNKLEEISKLEEIGKVSFDAAQMLHEVHQELAYGLTREILAEEKATGIPKEVTHVDVVAAYNSEADFRTDFMLSDPEEHRSVPKGLLFGQKIAVPAEGNLDAVLRRAVELSRDADFKKKRRELYDWQDKTLKRGYEPSRAVRRMDQLIAEYNACVKKAFNEVRYKLAFTVGTAALGLAGTALGIATGGAAAIPAVLAAGSAGLAVVRFATLDRKAVISETGESKPAAMFHAWEQELEATRRREFWHRLFGG